MRIGKFNNFDRVNEAKSTRKIGVKLNESTAIAPNEVRVWSYDYKENPDAEDRAEMKAVANATGGYFEELDVTTADSRIFVGGPDSFFDWLKSVDGKYGDAHEMFMDASFRYNEDTEEEEEEIVSLFMKDNELWVGTDKDKEYSYDAWYQSLL